MLLSLTLLLTLIIYCAPSEHLSSAAGNVTSKQRASLSSENVDVLAFV